MANGEERFLISQTVTEDILKNSVDLTLQFPDHLLHSIFSCLNFHDLRHVRLVCKKWHRNTPSHLALNFNESVFREKNPTTYSENEYWNSIRFSLDASKNKLINAQKRALRVQFNDCGDLHDIMKLLDGNDFHEVYLKIESFRSCCYYSYLPYIFQSKCLTILHLTNCELEKHVLLCGEEIIPSLQELKLEGVTLSEEILSKFISKCPNIRELSLMFCWRISFIVLTNLDRLKKLYVYLSYFHSFTNIQVVAPSLQVFHFILRSYESRGVPVNMDVRSCKMLREFHLDCWKFPNGLDPDNFCSDFPHLETLLMGPCQTEKPINISGSSLRKWILSFPQLYECSRRSKDSSPNLSSFQYKDTTFQPYLAPPSERLENNNNIVLVPKVHEIMNRAWFHKLRSHLENFSNYNTTLDLCVREEEVSKKLFGRGDRNCCSGTQGKCWRHFLKHFEIKREEEKEKFDVLSFHYVHPGAVKEDSDEKKDKLIFAFTWKSNR
uniref:F-box family protein n=1 Tax=Solanum tuberosum TaxID=4113 RepID=M1A435_SOLTU